MKLLLILFLNAIVHLPAPAPTATFQATPQGATLAAGKQIEPEKKREEKKVVEFKQLEGANAGGDATNPETAWYTLEAPKTLSAGDFVALKAERAAQKASQAVTTQPEARIFTKEKEANAPRFGSGVMGGAVAAMGSATPSTANNTTADLNDQARTAMAQQGEALRQHAEHLREKTAAEKNAAAAQKKRADDRRRKKLLLAQVQAVKEFRKGGTKISTRPAALQTATSPQPVATESFD
jgi:hypothetical protein